jgi:hypothetical protein
MRDLTLLPGFLLVCALSLGALCGCASEATYEEMQPMDFVPENRHPYSVSVSTAGGSETDPLAIGTISDAQFKAAIRQSIVKSRVFEHLIDDPGADYELMVRIIQVTPPHSGASFTVTMEAAWVLVRVADGRIELRKSIHSTYTATTRDKISAVARMRVALEGVARENITMGLREISRLAL